MQVIVAGSVAGIPPHHRFPLALASPQSRRANSAKIKSHRDLSFTLAAINLPRRAPHRKSPALAHTSSRLSLRPPDQTRVSHPISPVSRSENVLFCCRWFWHRSYSTSIVRCRRCFRRRGRGLSYVMAFPVLDVSASRQGNEGDPGSRGCGCGPKGGFRSGKAARQIFASEFQPPPR